MAQALFRSGLKKQGTDKKKIIELAKDIAQQVEQSEEVKAGEYQKDKDFGEYGSGLWTDPRSLRRRR